MEPIITDIIARRQFDPLYIWLDTAFLLLFAVLLLTKKRYATTLFGILGGILYLLVDYGIFHLLLGTRTISDGYSLFWVLLWMSMSYGFTNFVWIWLWLSKDRHLMEWSLLIVAWWFCCPLITATFGKSAAPVVIQRTTGAYHGYMAILLFAGYLGVILWNLFQQNRTRRISLPWLLAIGVLVQFCWEAALLLGGIRSAGFTNGGDKLLTLTINSLLETNLGIPYIYAIYIAFSSRFSEQLRRREQPLSFSARIEENNRAHVRRPF